MNNEKTFERGNALKVIVGYPFGVLLISVLLNIFVFGVDPFIAALPVKPVFVAASLAAVMLAVNHSVLMTTTELVRARYGLHATPEEWAASDDNPESVSSYGIQELARNHNTHRNATENTVIFAVIAPLFLLSSPPLLAAVFWFLGFGIGRLGHTYGFLKGRDGIRGLFMTVNLLSLYGMASYLLFSFFV
ncbi:MAPEG family protein [Parasalinivibrio latis]|uniref:MAPEG family protein n=1 Tax=Parasalinivibrio latis TaxID=2952610 RepID=UPI0030DE7166